MSLIFLMIRRPPRSTPFPYTTLCRSSRGGQDPAPRVEAADAMKTAIRKHLRDFVAVIGLMVIAIAVSSISEEHTSELQSRQYLVCRLLLGKISLPLRVFLLFLPSFPA